MRFRDRKLTYLLSDYLGGSTSGSTVMVVTAGPAAAGYDETLQAVKYGAVVKAASTLAFYFSTPMAVTLGASRFVAFFKAFLAYAWREDDEGERALCEEAGAEKRGGARERSRRRSTTRAEPAVRPFDLAFCLGRERARARPRRARPDSGAPPQLFFRPRP